MCLGLFVRVACVLFPLSMAFADEPQPQPQPLPQSQPPQSQPPQSQPPQSQPPPQWQPTMNRYAAPPPVNQPREDPAFAQRLQHRLANRLSVDLNLGIGGFKHQSNVGDPFPLVRLLLGFRKNLAPEWGFHLRAGPMLGMPWRTTSGDPGPAGAKVDSTILTGGTAEGLFIFGPYGSFFVGPVICLDYVHLTDTTLEKVYPPVHLKNGITGGGGFDLGGMFGSHEEVSAYMSLRLTAGVGESIISLLFGVGYLR
jgi:hypothetical protein